MDYKELAASTMKFAQLATDVAYRRERPAQLSEFAYRRRLSWATTTSAVATVLGGGRACAAGAALRVLLTAD
jgi:hypothetical protein